MDASDSVAGGSFGVKLAVAKSGSTAAAGSGNITEQIVFPSDAEAKTRKLTVEASPSIAGTIFGALEFLTSYPYGCSEQTMSSFLPNVLVADAMKKLGVGAGVNQHTLDTLVGAGLERLYQYQHPDGGWGWWPYAEIVCVQPVADLVLLRHHHDLT